MTLNFEVEDDTEFEVEVDIEVECEDEIEVEVERFIVELIVLDLGSGTLI